LSPTVQEIKRGTFKGCRVIKSPLKMLCMGELTFSDPMLWNSYNEVQFPLFEKLSFWKMTLTL